MRRKDREVLDYNRMLEIMEQCDCCRIGFVDTVGTYIVPINFGYQEENGKLYLYFHGAAEGKKSDLAKEQKEVGFEMDRKHELVEGKLACNYSYLYQSIMGKGTIELVENYEDKVKGLTVIMSHYSDKKDWAFEEKVVSRVSVMKLEVTEWSCKEH